MSVYFTSSNQKISVEQTPLGRGGEGNIYAVKSPSSLKQCCVKIYAPKFKTSQRKQKIEYMIKNPPKVLQDKHYKICWPKELIYNQNRQFEGFLMPLAFQNSIPLYELCLLHGRKGISKKWEKFTRKHIDGIMARCKLCINLAIPIHQLHSLNIYVFVDMKPQNILVTHDGKVSLIDFDSIQIVNGKKVLYPAQVMTPEYAPPEAERFNLSKDYIPLYWDRFSLAVIMYEILFGLHPFVNTCNHQYHDYTTIYEKIQNGLSYLGPNKNSIQILPQPHNKFNDLPPSLQNLFFRAFREGHHLPDVRPSAEEWGKTFYQEISSQPSPSSVHQQQYVQVQNSPVLTPVIQQPLQQQANVQVATAQKNDCFIATAVYESPLAEEVVLLRKFRDQTLSLSSCGRMFIKMYYRFSPTIAISLSHHNMLKQFVKSFILNPFVKFIEKFDD